MTINELKNWMSEQLEQGNSIAVVTAGQGGSGKEIEIVTPYE